MTHDLSAIPARLRELRTAARLTQAETADRAGISLSAYERLENGTNVPRADTLLRLCDVFETSADYILGRSDARESLPVGWYVIHGSVTDALDSTEEPKAIAKLCDEHRGALVELGTIIQAGSRLVSPAEGRAIERRAIAKIAQYGPAGLRKIFKQYEAEASRDE